VEVSGWPLGRLHHACESGAGESVLGGGSAPAGRQPVVDGVVGWLGLRCAVRRSMAENVGWRWIFFGAAAVSVIGMLMVRGTPESRAELKRENRFDITGVVTFTITMVALQVFATQGRALAGRASRRSGCWR
jgi:MFS family permease